MKHSEPLVDFVVLFCTSAFICSCWAQQRFVGGCTVFLSCTLVILPIYCGTLVIVPNSIGTLVIVLIFVGTSVFVPGTLVIVPVFELASIC